MTSAKSNATIFGLIIISIVITLFLFFIDEGYYDFRWMADKGNWVVFVIYVVLLLLPQLFLVGLYQWLLSPFIQRSWIHSSLQILFIVSGIASGITLAFMIWAERLLNIFTAHPESLYEYFFSISAKNALQSFEKSALRT